MRRLARFLKPYLPLFLLALVLHYVQANAELALPDYMSRIVTTGIQQNGIESAVPEALRQMQMDRITTLMTAEQRDLVLQSYQLVQPGSPEAAQYIDRYPVLRDTPVYVLKDIAPERQAELGSIMGPALVAVSGLEQMLADPAQAAERFGTAAGGLGIDLSRLPPGATVDMVLAALPEAQRQQISAAIGERVAALGASLMEQMAIAAVHAEYTALEMDVSTLQQAYIRRTGLTMLLISLAGSACAITVGLLASRSSSGVARDLRGAVFEKVESFLGTEFDRFSTASLITRTTNDVTQVQMLVGIIIRILLYAPILGIGGVIRAIDRSTSMVWLIALAVIALLGVLAVMFSIAMPRFRVIQQKIDRLNLVMREHLTGMMVIRAFNKQHDEEARFDGANRDLTSTMLFVARAMAVLMPIMTLIMSGLSLGIIWVGAHQIAESTLQVGDMMAFMQYAMQIVMAFMMMSVIFVTLPRAAVSADRIAEVLDTEPAIKDPPQPRPLPEPFRGSVEFRNVHFRYPNALDDVLHDITFTAQPGQTTALIGSTAARPA